MKSFYFLIILAINFIGTLHDIVPVDYVPKFLQKKYGVDFSSHVSGLKTANVKVGVKTFTKTSTSTKYKGGCNTPPTPPVNAELRCSTFSGCQATCIPDFQFPNKVPNIYIACEEGEWNVVGTEWDHIPSCEPICLPECENNGICVAPNQCNCPENFSGPRCQFENKPCLNYPPIPMNSRRSCNPTNCNVMCLPGHEFPDGSSISSMVCKSGSWVPTKENWVSIPDCRPTCDPPCQNGGNCLSYNVCQCPQEFRGPQCQYSIDACNSRKLGFNGGHNCTGNSETFSCSIFCPAGIKFEYPPAPVYVCTYETGIFIPLVIPQCVYEPIYVPYPTNKSDLLFATPGYNTIFGSSPSNVIPHIPILNMNETNFNSDYFGRTDRNFVTVEEKQPEPGYCLTWGGSHYKTFDGKVFSFNSKCAHTLIQDVHDNTFSITVQNSPECSSNPHLCSRIIKLYFQNKEFTLKHSDAGIPVFMSGKKIVAIPVRFPGLRVEMSAQFIIVSLDPINAKIKWDGYQLIQVLIQESLWNRTSGLCGRMDGDASNDLMAKDGSMPKSFTTLGSSWQVDTIGDECNTLLSEEHACQDGGVKGSASEKALEFCSKFLSDQRFAACHSVIDSSVLFDACRWDYCSCSHSDRTLCVCETINVYVKICIYKGIKTLTKWRDEKTCPMRCTGGRVYMPCAPKEGQEVCGASVENAEDEDSCEEGCYCPKGTVLHDSECITKDKCPCRVRGKNFAPGSTVDKDCNTCTCTDGQWICTQVSCGARCSAIGDPHYSTFDGKRYDFMGQCSYYLVKTDDFSIEAENVACAGAISLAMNFPITVSSGLPSCTKTITIKIMGQNIKLKQNHEVSVNEKDLTKLPHNIAGVSIRSASSIFIVVELPNGFEVWWDGLTRVYVNAPPTFKGKTKGLCGTFNDNQKDDFLTPENDIEHSVIPFANKWKTVEKCNDVPDKLKSHPCDINVQNRATAEEYCKKIRSNLFGDCHWYVDPEPFYQDCLYDMCSCEIKLSNCLCPIIAAYSHECALKKIRIDWRNDIKECGVHCPGGQIYQVCGNSCTRTCYDVATQSNCKETCIEGCTCPEGETLDELGDCIPIGQCKCQHEGLEFAPGYKEVRPASKGQELCTCINAVWSCRLATPDEIKNYPQAIDIKSKCDASKNFVFTTCESPEQVTCKNMHSQDMISVGICHAGCECKEGYVFDRSSETCVKPSECPCHHGGRSYGEKSVVQSECNTCVCENGKWNCTERLCSAECSSWGDSHFKTFDGRMYDYQGQCDYALAKGILNSEDMFDISIQNVPCGSLGVSCSKSVTIKVGSGLQQEHITLTRHKIVPHTQIFKRFTLRSQDLFVIVEAADLGLIVLWDRGTRVYVKVDPRWKNKLKGLCGNYNDNEIDDFQTPSGGVTEVSAQLFGDSWKLQSYCPEAVEITDTCEQRPNRRVWAVKQCGILKTPAFALCHSEVPVDKYYEACVFDSCACDEGGDCECLCTAIASYVHECNGKGVPIKWRSQELCPIQCDERCAQYSPCVSTCPLETCDNLLVQNPLSKLCKEDACVEGCAPKPCPPEFVYLNSSYIECVPRNTCKPFCLEINGTVYLEGDLMKEDECHSCFCSRGKETCTGQPCPETLTTIYVTTATVKPTTPKQQPPTVPGMYEDGNKCRSGWTNWINQDKAAPHEKSDSFIKSSDIEPLPNTLIMNNLIGKIRCDPKDIIDIECRTVKDHIPYKETGFDVECSLERGLICKSGSKPCTDFEIRVLCQCEERITIVPTESASYTTTPAVFVPCDVSQPHQEIPNDCHGFYHCVPVHNGTKLVQKTCGLDMMYNPTTQVCDWPNNVIRIKPECGEVVTPITTTEFEPEIIEPTENCPIGQKYESCAIECDKLCQLYAQKIKANGHCLSNSTKCVEGCVPETHKPCSIGTYAANENTCVAIQDCICLSTNGNPVKPSTVYRDGCKVCQCINNFYSCDESACKEEAKPTEISVAHTETVSEFSPAFVVTVKPQPKCLPDMFMNLIQGDQPLPDDAFSASSSYDGIFKPQNARLNNQGGNWWPRKSDKHQYLQINLGRQELVYGVVVQGSRMYPEDYVTTYKVSYSPDKSDQFSYVLDERAQPQIFKGSFDADTPVKQLFYQPVEAELVRIHPVTWHYYIALRVELIGCKKEELTTTVTYEITSTEKIPEEEKRGNQTEKPEDVGIIVTPNVTETEICKEPIGFDKGVLSDQLVSVSSEFSPAFSKEHLKLSASNAWQPLVNSPTEWIEFNFLEPHIITGVQTKGGPDGWVTEYIIKYSDNDREWNPITDAEFKEKIFLGNSDHDLLRTNMFDTGIFTTFIKIIPIKWHSTIQLKAEPLGCLKQHPSCPPGQKYESCAIECDKLCQFYSHTIKKDGHCLSNSSKCVEGCVPETHKPCSIGTYAANENTCVAIQDCICLSPNGNPVKPSTVHKEGCKVCQCINNVYSCDESACEEEEAKPTEISVAHSETVSEFSPAFVVTVTPPQECLPDMFVNLIQGDQPLPDDAFSASSIYGSSFEPKYAKLNNQAVGISGGSWKPEKSDKLQYLQINLGRQEPVYGVIVQGSPLYTEFVTSYKVSYSPDKNEQFSYVLDDKTQPQIFRGSVDANSPVKQLFYQPIEAEIIRIHPLTWHSDIALRVELIGCKVQEPTTTATYEITSTEAQPVRKGKQKPGRRTKTPGKRIGKPGKRTKKPEEFTTTVTSEVTEIEMCKDPMGLDEGMMSDQLVSVSSEFSPAFSKKHLKLSAESAWQPFVNSPTEWIEFNFVEPHTITGIQTKGGPDGWVTEYNVKYSHNNKEWNPILDEELKEKKFLGNFDHDVLHTNMFDLPIRTTFIKIIPIKWHSTIQLKVEPLGCFKQYPPIEEVTEISQTCNNCPGISSAETGACHCTGNSWWDGEDCISRNLCPCMVEHIPYAVGKIFQKEDCSNCICKIGGNALCTPKQCEKCDKGLKSTVTSTCGCLCLPCEDDEILCPTSNICINATKWCNGIEDCPDDEIDCPTTPGLITTTTTLEPPIKKEEVEKVTCVKPNCPSGYKVIMKSSSKKKKYTMFYPSDHNTQYLKSYSGIKTGRKTGVKGGNKLVLQRPVNIEAEIINKKEECPEFECVSTHPPPPPFITGKPQIVCPPTVCPPQYNIEFIYVNSNEACPRYNCIPPPPPDAVCSVVGRTFNTFDNVDYIYDICNHILARDLENDEWDVSLKKSCEKLCTRHLIIHQQDDTFILYPNSTVEYNGYKYTMSQTKKIGSQSQAFSIRKLGDILLFVSNRYGFWVIWDNNYNAKIGVSTKLTGKVDGLCGYYNENPNDDKRKPDGKMARTTSEFGDSWGSAEQPPECEAKVCPIHLQNKAWEMCNKVKDKTLSPCAKETDIQSFISRCLETTCACLQAAKDNHTVEENCRCQTLQSFIGNCMQANSSVELTDWRVLHDCPVTCPVPLIHHDCYRRPCEPACETIADPNACRKLENICFPGCYCPPGLVRKGESCVEPSTCRDCECTVLPHLQYVTYDNANFTINGNCVYVMSQDGLENKKDSHKFQVLITNAPCEGKENLMCVGKVTVVYEDHKIHIIRDNYHNKLMLTVDGVRIDDFSDIQAWAEVIPSKEQPLKILLKQAQIEVTVHYETLSVSIKAPSHKYGGKLEGLCGNCNKNPDDDIKTPDGKHPDNIEEFGLSWLYDKLPGQTKENCAPILEPICQPLSSDVDPCQKLLDIDRFGQCHLLLDPTMFVEWCNKDICDGDREQACVSIGAYAKECMRSNVCVNWHSILCPAEVCPPGKIYNPCGTSCPKTCDNINENNCEEVPVDGCFCPVGKVLLNNTCVEPRECEICDEEGHHPGDTWQKDACTTCSCIGTTLNCETKHCSNTDTICEEGFNSVKVPSDTKQCCDKYICVPAPTQGPTCEPPQQLQCSVGQIIKMITSADGCQKFICECKPIEECEPIDTSTDLPLEDGIEKIINNDDCCPTVKKVCNVNRCPPLPNCPSYYSIKKTEIPEKCCPIYNCIAPEKCIVYVNISVENGEREKRLVIKEVDETWSDDPCKECKCIKDEANGYHSTCTVKDCPLLTDSPDKEDFVLETEPVLNQCCSNIKRVACIYNGKTYKIGEKWQVEGDYCSTMECANTETGLQKLTEKTACDTNCKPGYKYVPSLPESKQCCGSCKCVACIVDGVEHKIGETWQSPDFCSMFKCLDVNGSALVQEAVVSCLSLPSEVEDFVYETYSVPGECCKKYKPTACKVGNVTYKVGETWPSPDFDKCKNVTCVENSIGELVKQEAIKTCNKNCSKGWEYIESYTSCCGECKPVACVVDNEIKKLGETWFSSDNCTKYSCEELGDQFSVLSEQESCPSISNCKPENVYVKGCCKHCKLTMENQKDCAAEKVNPESTIGLVKFTKAFKGVCTNKSPLPGFIECIGICKSPIEFSTKNAAFESSCSCCRAIDHKIVVTELTCEDGSTLLKQISVPTACSCNGCATEDHANLTKTHTKTGVKTGTKGGVKTGVKGGVKTGVKTGIKTDVQAE